MKELVCINKEPWTLNFRGTNIRVPGPQYGEVVNSIGECSWVKGYILLQEYPNAGYIATAFVPRDQFNNLYTNEIVKEIEEEFIEEQIEEELRETSL